MEVHKSSGAKFAESMTVLQPILAKIVKKQTGVSVSPCIEGSSWMESFVSPIVKQNAYNAKEKDFDDYTPPVKQ